MSSEWKSKKFLDEKKLELLSKFEDEHFHLLLPFLVDIFDILNQLNLKLQGKDSNILSHSDFIRAFIGKLDLYKQRISQGNVVMFPKLVSLLNGSSLPMSILTDISHHISELKNEFQRYFPELIPAQLTLVRNPFLADVNDCQRSSGRVCGHGE